MQFYCSGALLHVNTVQSHPAGYGNSSYERDRHECPVVAFPCDLLVDADSEEVLRFEASPTFFFAAATRWPPSVSYSAAGFYNVRFFDDEPCLFPHFWTSLNSQLSVCHCQRWTPCEFSRPVVPGWSCEERGRRRRGRVDYGRLQVPLC